MNARFGLAALKNLRATFRWPTLHRLLRVSGLVLASNLFALPRIGCF